MPSWTVNKCCGCYELKTGCLIIGYLKLVATIIFMILGVTGLVTGGVLAATSDDEKKQDAGVAIVALSAFLVLILSFSLAFTVVLLIGVHKNKRSYLKVYLIVTVILLILGACVDLFEVASDFDAVQFCSKFVGLSLNIYLLMVIRSYYYEMDDQKRPVCTKA